MERERQYTYEQEIKLKYDEQASDFHFEQKLAAEDFGNPEADARASDGFSSNNKAHHAPVRPNKRLERLYTKVRQSYIDACASYREAIKQDIREARWIAWDGPQYRAMIDLQKQYFEIKKEMGIT